MKIMHFISSAAAGGAEIFVRDLSVMAAKDQHSVVIVFMDRAEDVARDVAFETEFLKSLAEVGIQYEFIGSGARKNLLKGAIKLRQIVKMHKPDVLHCHLYYAAIFSLFVRKVPVIYTHHNYKLRAPRKIYKILDLRVSAYIGICFACYNLLRSVSSRPVIHIDNGVALDRLKVKAAGGAKPKNPTRVVMIGSLTKQKNYNLIIRAMSSVSDLGFDLVIAGEGPEKEVLLDEVYALGLTDRIHFLGNVRDIPDLLMTADVFAMSSAWEGLPIALIEATLSGLPVIVTNVGGCSEVVHSVCNGIVVDAGAAEPFADGLRRLLGDQELRAFFSRNAKLYGSRYSLDVSYRKHMELYRSLKKDTL